MAERIVLALNAEWAILFDRQQWIIAKARKRRTGRDFKPLAYLGSTTTTLRRVLREMSVEITPAAQQVLNVWPERFTDWRDRRSAEMNNGRLR